MRPRRAIVLLVVVVGLLLATSTASAQVIQYTCSPGASDCSGWRASDVVLSWYPSPAVMDSDNCPIAKLLTAEGVTNWLCGVLVSGQWAWYTATVRIEKERAAGDRRDAEPASGRQRLVSRAGRLRVRRHRRGVGDRRLHHRHVRPAGQARGVGDRDVH